MRKITIFFICVLLVVLMVVPAFAVGESGSSSDMWYSALTFDTIEFEGSSYCFTTPFPFNSAVYGSGDFAFLGDTVSGSCSMKQVSSGLPTISGFVSSPHFHNGLMKSSVFSFCGGQQIVDMNRISDYMILYSYGDLGVTKALLTGYYYSIVPDSGDNSYCVERHSFSWNVSVNSGIIYVGASIKEGLFLEGLKDRYIFFDRMELQITCHALTVATPRFDFNIPTCGSTAPNSAAQFESWLSQYSLPINKLFVNPGYFDMTSWLENGIGGFLRLEIAPGFSIDKIIYIILTVGILLAVLKGLT